MKKLNQILILSFLVGWVASVSFAGDIKAVTISKPTVSSSLVVCMTPWGVDFEPAKKGVNEGKGHNHILVDIAFMD